MSKLVDYAEINKRDYIVCLELCSPSRLSVALAELLSKRMRAGIEPQHAKFCTRAVCRMVDVFMLDSSWMTDPRVADSECFFMPTLVDEFDDRFRKQLEGLLREDACAF